MKESEVIEGTLISHYRVIARLGAGGMGEVYLAKDTRLDRTVALKILPAEMMAREERMGRFTREAKTASALNHPNIITIYEIGQAETDSIWFIATEYIDGVTLRQHLSQTTLTIIETLDLAIQTASALAAAHEAGVIHRDIKPENIMLRRDGILKVLDFGLAKLTEAWDRSTGREAQTLTLLDTVPGTVLGTTAYMSPEQARGRDIDERSDIWSLGVLLYEMVAGRIPFLHDTPSDVIAAILRADPPPLSTFTENVPAELERIVAKTLEKNRDERYQGIKDLLVDLRRLRKQLEFENELESFNSSRGIGAVSTRNSTASHFSQSGVGLAQRNTTTQTIHATSNAEYIVSNIRRHKNYAFAGLAVLVLAFVVVAYGFYRFATRTRVPSATPALSVTRFTATGKATHATISADGRYVAHVADEAGQQSIWIGQVAAASQVQIMPTAPTQYLGLTFTRDGEFLYFVAADRNNPKGALYQIPVLGGAARKVLEDVQSPITLSPDGKSVAFIRYPSLKENALLIANADGSNVKELAKHSSPDFFSTMAPAWSPDGTIIACVYQNTSGGYYENVVGVHVADGAEAPLNAQRWWQVGQVAWLADGKSLMASATEEAGSLPQLWNVPYNGSSAKRLTNDLNGYVDVSLTADSKILASVRSDRLVNLSLWTSTGGTRQITSGTERDDGMRGLSWTPDGKIVYRSVAGGEPNVWLMSADGTGQRQLTLNTSQNFDPVVSPDGRHIAWGSQHTGNTNIWQMDIDGGNAKQITKGVGDYFPAYTPDGKSLLYTAYDPVSSFWSVYRISVDGGAPVRMTQKESALAAISPDGKYFACNYEDTAGAGYQIAIIPIDGGQPVKMFAIPGSFGRTIQWTPDGNALTYLETRAGVSNVWQQNLSGGPAKQLTDFKDQRIFGFAWSRDGKQLALSRGVVNSDVLLLQNFRQ